MTGPVRRTRRDERGVSATLFALMLTALLTMSALVVDIGAAFTERRHDQNTADAAVMSAVVESVLGGGVINDVVAEVRVKVDTTLGRTVTDQQWLDCDDPDQLHYTTNELKVGNPTISPATDCISFNISFDRVRVKLPDQDVQEIFAKSLGLADLKTSASAEAEVVNGAGTGAPPFVALSTATQGDFVCLRTSSNPQPQTLLKGMGPGVNPQVSNRPDPCDKTVYDVSSENFGTISPYRYQQGCTRQNADIEVAVSLGIDHIMGFFPNGFSGTLGEANAGDRVDGGANCTTAFPNTFAVDTGFNAQGLRCALISLSNSSTCNGEVPRFQQGPFVQSTHKFAGENMDNAAPWDFLRPASELYEAYARTDKFGGPAPEMPDECVVLAASRTTDGFESTATWSNWGLIQSYPWPTSYAAQLAGDGSVIRYAPNGYTNLDLRTFTDASYDHYDKYDLLVECLEQWNGLTDDELFTVDLGLTPRFAFIPKVAEPNLNKAKYVHIESFLPTFMYRTYQNKSSGTAPCDPLDPRASVQFFVHDAGRKISCGASNSNVDRLSSIMLACGMVPDELCNKDTGQPDFAGQDIYEFRLAE